ncbi:MAG TPA: serine/threonine-protein kinase, partial [Myxococcota bacterium]
MSAHLDDDSSERLPRWFGDYVLLKRLGHGGMGQVFLARSPGLHGIDRLCVIKTLRAQWTNDREYVARFVDEARVVVQLNHRNICPVFDVGQHHNTYYLAMDLVPGRDLQAVLQRTTHLGVNVGVDVALQIVAEVVDALDAAHRLTHLDDDTPLNLVHRDVSPHNVLVSFDGEVKLIDFGLAHSALKNEHTEPGVVLGKLAYMAPEHARGDVVDRRADLFAVGVILYELLVGDRFWAGLSVTEIWQQVGSGQHRPPRLAHLDTDVRALIERAIAANPADRFASGAEMRKAIVAAQIARGIVADAADVRALMERLFAGEALADRKERGALQKLPAPPRHDVGSSTRIAAAPSSRPRPMPPAVAPPAVPPSSPPPTGDEDPTFNER